tara:strand:+ start:159 stop:719 length:561 start_codon:yes stop_codon:yes gene_type:complete
MINIDTDRIIPKQFLKTIKRTGLGQFLFNDLRYNANGTKVEEFVLNRPAFQNAQIIIAGRNFGCGSSREHAPWALLDFGIRCVIAPSFADIFYNNCFKNGILPVQLTEEEVAHLLNAAEAGANATFTVDLDTQLVTDPNGGTFKFEVDAFQKHCLFHGLDDIGLTLDKAADIDKFEENRGVRAPWL